MFGRGTSASDSAILCRLLQLRQNASVFATGMRRFLVRFIRPETFVQTRFLAGFTITKSGFKFSVHTTALKARPEQHPISANSFLRLRARIEERAARKFLDVELEGNPPGIEINEVTTAIAAAVKEQGVATCEIARNIQDAVSGTSEVSSNIAGVSTASAEAGAAASGVLSASGALRRDADILRDEIHAFLTNIRAA